MGKKRGQVTAFVIIGIVLVAAAVLIVYTKNSGKLKEAISESASLPPQIQEVSAMLEGCLADVSKEGIDLLGLQGGYIDLEQTGFSTAFSFSNALPVVKGGGSVAYWWYKKDNGIEVNAQPSLVDMERELERHIDSNFDKCADYRQFIQQGYKFSAASPVSQVDIGKEAVIVQLNYPIKINYHDSMFNINKLKANLPSSLGKLHQIAQEISRAEHESTFLENKTLDFMVVYDEIPYSGVDFECQPRTWIKEQVKKDFKAILARNIPYIKFAGGGHTFKEKYFLQDEFALPKDVDVDFQYNEEWPFKLEVIGKENEPVLAGEQFTDNKLAGILMPIFCLNQYHFIYNLEYPVLASIHKGDEVFQFAHQVVIDHNQPRTARILPIEIPKEEDAELCRNVQDKLSISAYSKDELGDLIPLQDVDVNLECVTARCSLGKTNARGELQAMAPACVQGIVSGEKSGYRQGQERISFTGDSSISLVLGKVYPVEYDIFVVENGNARQLSSNEQAFARLESVEGSYSSAAIAPGKSQLNLVAGEYKISSYLLTESSAGISIPDKKIKVCNNVPRPGFLGMIGMTEKQCSEQTLKGTALDQVISGGDVQRIDISEADLAAGRKLQIFVTSHGIPRTYDALTKMQEKIKKSKGTAPGWEE